MKTISIKRDHEPWRALDDLIGQISHNIILPQIKQLNDAQLADLESRAQVAFRAADNPVLAMMAGLFGTAAQLEREKRTAVKGADEETHPA